MSDPLVILDALPSAAGFMRATGTDARFGPRRGRCGPDGAVDCAGRTGRAVDGGNRPCPPRVQADWSCRFGPFAEDDFSADKDDAPWSLLVQNVDQFHPETANLLRLFGFAPRWLMDDIMVSFSNAGGGIGGHVDSYHVFLVQGQGVRRWTVGRGPAADEIYINGLDLKILRDPVEGDTFE